MSPEARAADADAPVRPAPPAGPEGEPAPAALAPPTVFALVAGGMVALSVLVPEPRATAGGWRLLGLLPVLAGVGLHRAAWRRLRRRRTPVRADRAPRVLVTEGPYRRTRNPMYVSGVLILAGGAALLGPAAAFVAAPAFAWIVQRRFLPGEEEVLEHRFGEAYRSYRDRVRRWI